MKMEECIVTQVYPERATVRVKREQSDGVISQELPILFQWTLKNQAYSMPKIDEHVVCIFNGSNGYVLGSIYSDVSTPPVRDVQKHYFKFEDGNFFEYDSTSSELTVQCKKLTVKGDIECIGSITSTI